MIKRSKSIFFRLSLAFILLGLLPLCIAGTVLYAQFSRNLERVMLDDMTHMLANTSSNIAEIVEECNALTKLIYEIPVEDKRWLWEILKDREEKLPEKKLKINGLMKSILERDSKITSVYFIEGNGQIYYATANTQKVLDETALKKRLKQMNLEEPGLSVGVTHTDDYFPQSKNQVITFSRPYRDVSEMKTLNRVMGRLYVDVDLSKLQIVLQEINQGNQGEFRLLDGSGVCIYSTVSEESGRILPEGEEWLSGMEGQQGNIRSRSDYRVYREIPGCGWKAVLQIPRQALMQNLDQTRRVVLFFVGGSFVVLFLLYDYFLRGLRKPVDELKNGMRAIRKGDLTVRVSQEREDELGVLARGLNHMAEELELYIRRVYIAEIRQREAELDALKSQIKPHYLYNTLDVIRMMALEHEDQETAKMVESLSRQLKYLIGYNSDIVPLRREIDNIREYFVIMRVRYENRIHLELDISEEAAECGIIKLSLQPIVENAVRHGLRPKKEGGSVRIEAVRTGDELEITVMDDGVGMNEETLAALRESLEKDTVGERMEDGWHHVGLKNAYDRIQKNFGKDYGMEIISNEGVGTVVIYHLPLLNGDKEEQKSKWTERHGRRKDDQRADD